MTSQERKDLRLHTLKGDIHTCLKDGMTVAGTRNLLKARYVTRKELGVTLTSAEFETTLATVAAKA